MKKNQSKKAVSQKKINNVANKKNQKADKKSKTEIKKKFDYPDWTTPEHLSENDHNDLKRFYELFIAGKIISAFSFASNFETVVREAIPPEIWKQSGGKLTAKGEEQLKPIKEKGKTALSETFSPENDKVSGKEKNQQQKPTQKATTADFSAFILKDDLLEPITIENSSELIKKVIRRNELEDLVLTNSKTFFGQQILIIRDKETQSEFFPDKILFAFKEAEKPRMYLMEVAFSTQNFGNMFACITHFIASLKNKNRQNEFLVKLCDIIEAKKEQKKELQSLIKDKEIPEFLSEAMDNKPAILLVIDDDKSDLKLMQETYTETWGKMVKQILIKKHSMDKDTIYTMSPAFADIWKNEKNKTEVVKSTEEDHLNAVSENIRNIYNEIKDALLKADDSIQFNAKKIYISVRKNKNLAFFHLRKKISLVVMSAEDFTRTQIKHHEIKSLPASVQKFWNGPSCTIIIENRDNLTEVINLLEKMIARS